MNRFIIFISFIFVLTLHLVVFYVYKTENTSTLSTKKIAQIVHIEISKVIQIQETTKTEIQKTPQPQKEEIKKEVKEVVKKPKNKEVKEVKQSITEPKPIVQNDTTTNLVAENIPSTSAQEKTQSEEKTVIKENIEDKLINEYGKKLREAINKNKIYPNISRKLKEQGTAIVSFKVLKDGTFKNIIIKESCNFQRLNDAALNTIKETNNFEAFGDKIKKDFLEFNLPIEFSLN